MKSIGLTELLQGISKALPELSVEVTGLADDSRNVKPGDLFIAISGHKVSGLDHIPQAIKKGACAILVDHEDLDSITNDFSIPVLSVSRLSKQVGEIAARFFNNPSKSMIVTGITGTNGKTTCTHWLAQALNNLGKMSGLIGTLGIGNVNQLTSTGFTTPFPITLQSELSHMQTQGFNEVCMEVSSHALDQGRVNAVDFRYAIFTNLSHDHLDYHGDFRSYGEAKERLFMFPGLLNIVINYDDPFGKQMIRQFAGKQSIVAYGCKKAKCPHDIPYVHAEDIEYLPTGSKALINTSWGKSEVTIPFYGEFNLYNMMAVMASLLARGFSMESVIKAIGTLKPIPGRMQNFSFAGKPQVIVDYAHTPDALEKVLNALKAHSFGKLYCIFGCGGERDRAKRPLMAKVAETIADHIVVTADNSRLESLDQIVRDIFEGFSKNSKVTFIPDRKNAITETILNASKDDIILVAGKGVERFIDEGGIKIPSCDIDIVNNVLVDGMQNKVVGV